MKLSDEKSVNAALKGGTLRFPVLIYGSEEYLKRAYLERILGKRPEGGLAAFNDIRIDFSSLDPQKLADALLNPPVMAEYKTVLVYDVSPKEIGVELFKQMEGLFKESYADCRAVFLEKSGTVDDKRDDKSKKLIKLFDQYGSVLQFKERTETDLGKLLRARAEKAGCTLSPAAQKLLLSRCGREMTALYSELDKLCFYRPAGEISEADVEQMVTRQAEDNIFSLSRAILRGDYDGAMRILHDLLVLRTPQETILGTLAQYYVDLYRARAAAIAGVSAARAAEDFGYGRRAFAFENALRDQRKLSEGYLCYALDVLSDADIRLKSTQNDTQTVLEAAVTALFIREPGKGRGGC
ncbi:MAG: DNA polymerase III subunit delta [Provencibacterium sp.]|jgi:DNA polymerase-3 subunit delta|nr:DNA polymerase III subunit delta [Provencibacterium sp.]